ncbi:MAG: LysR substrate-binding domain-containing protein [Rhodospirillales bacterium]
MRNVTVRQLQMFVESADTGSFTRAAERLHVSPAAVSFQIKQIEDGTGFTLFERIGKKVAPTDAGRALLRHARIVLQTLVDADQSLMALSGMLSGRAKLGAVSTAKYIVPHIMARFQQQFPGVMIDLRFGNRRQIATRPGTRRNRAGGHGPPSGRIRPDRRRLRPAPHIAGRQPHAPARRRPRPWSPRISPASPSSRAKKAPATRLLMEKLCADAGIPARIAMTTDSNETIKQAVMAGMGVAVLSQHTVGLELALGLLKTLPMQGFPVQRSWFVAHRRAMPLMPAHAHLCSFFQQHGQAVIDELEHGYRAAAHR